ncbi:acyltransferase family protein [Thalassotalea aquiviva]|uniref:acyltransferase family protein n=1 Tax=Thalassotalea aquiviva TaxID=3242415 RepID=UPI00352A27F8
MEYRKDIDGLRSVAVLLVIFHHAGFGYFSGGFVGVDVFFVISGFLITSIIYPRILAQEFSFKWFFTRRLKRLMPVLYFVILVTCIAFSFILLPNDLTKLYQSVVWVSFYIGNFFFWIHHGGYFDGNSLDVPLLHTWSLAVEEQFYFVWPLMLVILVKLVKPKACLAFVIALCIFATLFSQWGTINTIGAAYYLLPTRFFELLIGAVIAMGWRKYFALPILAHHFLSISGLSLIFASAFMLSEHSPFPGFNALFPVLGTGLLIISYRGIGNHLLSKPFAVFTGQISYSLYLWHWPVFTFMRYKSIELSLLNATLAIVIIYILSYFSWKYIECPFRVAQIRPFRQVLMRYYALPTILLTALATFNIANEGFPSRFSDDVVLMDRSINSNTHALRKGCHASFRESEQLPSEECVITSGSATTKSDKKLFLIGDSHANHLLPFIQALTQDLNIDTQDYTLDRCLPVFDLPWGTNLVFAKRCIDRNLKALEYIQNNDFQYVVLAASWPDITTRRIISDEPLSIEQKKMFFQQKLFASINAIINAGSVPILIEDIPSLQGKSPKCPIRKRIFNDNLDCTIERPKNQLMADVIHNIEKQYPQVKVIRPMDLFCDQTSCQMVLNNIPLYRDDNHLSALGSKELGVQYRQSLDTVFQ